MDYETLPRSVTIPATAASTAFSLTPIDDTLEEGTEDVVVALATGSGYAFGSSYSAVVAIIDDDAAVTAPTPPIGLSAVTISQDHIDLDWSDNPEAGVAYNVYRGSSSEFLMDASTLLASNITASSYADTEVAPSTRYYYRVTATASGVESFSEEIASQVTAFDVQPSGIEASMVDESAIELWWNDDSANETGYTVELSDPSGTPLFSQDVAPDTDFYEFTGLSADTEYVLNVHANFANSAPMAPLQAGAGRITENRPDRADDGPRLGDPWALAVDTPGHRRKADC